MFRIVTYFAHRRIADRFCPLYAKFVNKRPVNKRVYSIWNVSLHNLNKHIFVLVQSTCFYLYCTMRENWCRAVMTTVAIFWSVNRTRSVLIHAHLAVAIQGFSYLLISLTCWFVCGLIRYTHTHTHTRTSEDSRPRKWQNFLYLIQFIQLHRGVGKVIARSKWGDEPGGVDGYPKVSVLILNITQTNKIIEALFVRLDISHKPTLLHIHHE